MESQTKNYFLIAGVWYRCLISTDLFVGLGYITTSKLNYLRIYEDKIM